MGRSNKKDTKQTEQNNPIENMEKTTKSEEIKSNSKNNNKDRSMDTSTVNLTDTEINQRIADLHDRLNKPKVSNEIITAGTSRLVPLIEQKLEESPSGAEFSVAGNDALKDFHSENQSKDPKYDADIVNKAIYKNVICILANWFNVKALDEESTLFRVSVN